MSQRLGNEIDGYKRHPLTGEILAPIGYTSRGPIWPVLGAAPPEDDEDDKEDDETEDDSTEGGDSGDGTGEPDDDAGSADGDDTSGVDDADATKGKTYTQAEYEALANRMKAADRAKAAAEAEVRKFKDKDKSELQRATDRVTELESESKKLSEDNNKLRIQNAFLSTNSYTWHDPDDALNLADLSGVKVDEDGNVDKDALKAALAALAKAKPHLVKASNGSGPSGDANAGRKRSGSNKDEKSRRAQIAKRFPSTFAR